MKINYILLLVIVSVFLTGCLNQEKDKTENSKIIIADEKFCIAHTPSNISSDEAYQVAIKSDCAQAGIIKEDCNCDSSTYVCSFTLEVEKPGCNPVCRVNLKTQKAEIDWQCNNEVKADQ